MTVALVVLTGLIPALVMWSLAPAQRRRARAWWLLCLGGAVAAGLAPLEPWLTVALVALLVWWGQSPDAVSARRGGVSLLPVIGSWLAIAATWFLVRTIPAGDTPWILGLWGVLGWAQAAYMIIERRHIPWTRRAPHGGFGQRMYAGCFMALLCCVLPVWAWPGPLVGLFLSGPSWLALLALGAGSAVRWPAMAPALGSLLLGAVTLFLVAKTGHVWGFRWLPRGDSLDSLRQRVWGVRLALRDLARHPGAWPLGFGPGTAERATYRWHSRVPKLDPNGNLHCEPLQVVYEFGLLGLLGVGLFAWRIGGGLTWGDPWSAAAVAAAVVACGSNLSGIIPLGLTALVIWARVAP